MNFNVLVLFQVRFKDVYRYLPVVKIALKKKERGNGLFFRP